MSRSAFVMTACLLLAAGALPAQQTRSATGSVTGHVLCADTHRPARMAAVYLVPVVERSAGAAAKGSGDVSTTYLHVVQTGLDGGFTLSRVRPGSYYLVADKAGYLPPLDLISRDEMNKPDKATADLMGRLLTPVSVAANRATQVEATVYRGGSLSGTVRFDDGTAVAGASVSLSRRGPDGRWAPLRLQPTQQSGSVQTTDDDGRYRLFGLPGGEYLVCVSLSLNELDVSQGNGSEGMSMRAGYALKVYLGDKFRESAGKPVKLGEGEEAAALDLTVPLSKMHTVRGSVIRKGSGQVVNAATLSLRWSDTGKELTSATVSADDDAFQFDFVPEGEYTLHVSEARAVIRTEVPNCEGCVPRTQTREKVVERFADIDQALVVQTDQQAITVAVAPAGVK